MRRPEYQLPPEFVYFLYHRITSDNPYFFYLVLQSKRS